MLRKLIEEAIAQRFPKAFGKLGGVEARALLGEWDEMLGTNAGVFPLTKDVVDRWRTTYISGVAILDGVVQWQHGADAELIRMYCPRAEVSAIMEDLWPVGLEGKKVLVVHPMVHTIAQQKQFWQHWGGIELIHVPYPPRVLGKQSFATYFHALQWMESCIEQVEFDVAIVGAGAYSLPLLRYIKLEKQRPCLHLGGRTQLLFGILGRRWDKDPTRPDWYGGAGWIRPLPIDTPPNKHLVERGCYW